MAEESTPQEAAGNQFANDGSFMEMFRKKMEEQQKAKECLEKSEGKDSKRTESVQGVVHQKPKLQSAVDKPPQGIIGKRKALEKTNKLREKRKRRREEMEEQQTAEEAASRGSAWKSYMAEVKAYESRCCMDSDGHKRPLVK